MAQAPEFKDFLPGLEFFQTFLQGAGLPSNLANWVAPTLDVGELDRKIAELKAVLGWLEANARVTQSMIQGLEVQRMTLATLQTMNVDLREFARQFGTTASAPQPGASPAPSVAPVAGETSAASAESPAADEGAEGADGGAAAAGQPLAWWDAITRQFTALAARALAEGPGLAAGFGRGRDAASPPAGTAAAKAEQDRADQDPATRKTTKTARAAARDPSNSVQRRPVAKTAARQRPRSDAGRR